MTNAENDREAVEWLEEAIRRHEAVRMAVPGPVAPDLTEALAHERRILALAREALAMRERGVWAWCVEPDDDDDELLPPTERGGGGRTNSDFGPLSLIAAMTGGRTMPIRHRLWQ